MVIRYIVLMGIFYISIILMMTNYFIFGIFGFIFVFYKFCEPFFPINKDRIIIKNSDGIELPFEILPNE